MQIYSATLKGPLKMSGYIDPDDTTRISVFWKPLMFETNSVYYLGDICKPSIDNGYYYQCSTAGRSGLIEPIWEQDTTISGTVEFTAVPWDLWLLPTESITNSIWTSSENITLIDPVITESTTTILITPFANTILEFDLTNQVTKTTGETLSRTFKYKTNQQ